MVALFEVGVAAAVARCADEVGARGVGECVAAGEGLAAVVWGVEVVVFFGAEEVGCAAEENGVLVADEVGRIARVLFLGL